MGKVVTDGTGKAAALDWCVVGGKTGTARKLDPVTKQYVSKHYASFVGVAPLDDPRLLCYIVIDEPRGNIYGGSTAAPAFREIIEAAGKSPRPIVRPDFAVVPAGPATSSGVEQLARRLVAPLLTSVTAAAAETAAVHSQLAAEPDTGAVAESLMVVRAASGPPAPDYVGLPFREVIRRATVAGLKLKVTGMGVVLDQFPVAGEPVPNHELTLFLGDREELEKPEENEDP
jgi:cell division protein FtsI (penicillin-binding protein 3)